MKFKACKYLSFNTTKYPKCSLIKIDDHLCWERKNPAGELELCQFCTCCGRLNNPSSCIDSSNTSCSNYTETEYQF